MATTITVEDHSNGNNTAHSPSATNAAVPLNIKRNVPVFRYGGGGILGKKSWKSASAIIYDDSTIKVFKDAELKKPTFQIKLENVALYMAFGEATQKYRPPPLSAEDKNFISSCCYIAIPESHERDKIHWFAAKDKHGLEEIIQAIAETLEGKVIPPQLGKGKARHAYNDNESKWKTYWLTCAQQAADASETNGEQQLVATPLVIVASPASPSPTKPIPPAKPQLLNKPQPLPRQAPTPVVVEMPTKIESLQLQHDGGLHEDGIDAVPVIRLVDGKRVREMVKCPNTLEHQDHQQPPLPSTPPPAEQTLVYKSEIKTFVSGEPEVTTISIGNNTLQDNGDLHNDHHSESHCANTIVNVGGSEPGPTEENLCGVTYTTTKRSSYTSSNSTYITSN